MGIILDAEGTRANRKEEIAITQTMVERIERRFNIRPERLVGDTVYGVARLLKWLVDRKITPHVPVWDKSARHDGIFSRARHWKTIAYFAAVAAFSINAATSRACERKIAWLPGSSMTCDWARFAMNRSRSGLIIRSCLEITA